MLQYILEKVWIKYESFVFLQIWLLSEWIEMNKPQITRVYSQLRPNPQQAEIILL